MKKETVLTATGKQYAVAYKAHNTTKALREALKLCSGIIAESPDPKEAEYSRMQIQNIMNAVVPKKEQHDAQWLLALSHITYG
jgi:hypothetical protein